MNRDELQGSEQEALSEGRWGNARVLKVRCADGAEWVVKDFAGAPWLVRNTFARLVLARELRALRGLNGCDGTPARAHRVDRHAIAYRYAPGRTLKEIKRASEPVGPDLFLALEALVTRMHARGFVHLDLRNARNIVVGEGGHPALIDFQTSVCLRGLPRPLRRMLEQVDLSGVYKWWGMLSPETMDEERRQRQSRWNLRRILWPFRGYRIVSIRSPRRLRDGEAWRRSEKT